MLTTTEITLNLIVVLLFPLTVYSLVTGSKPPERTILTQYYRAEKHLNFVGNLFLLSLCANSIAKLSRHFELIGADLGRQIEPYIQVPFIVLLIAFAGLWIKAALKVRRQPPSTPRGAPEV